MKLSYYIIRRLLLLIPTLIGATLIVFLLTRAGGINNLVSPYISLHSGVPQSIQIQKIKQMLGLNQPLYLQYFYFLNNLIHGNLGYTRTTVYSGPVTTAMAIFFPNTIQLAVVSFILAMVIGIPLGTIAAVRKDSSVDQITRVIAFVGISLPVFLVAEVLMVYLASSEGIPLFPMSGTVNGNFYASWFQGGISYPTHILIIDSLLHGNISVFLSAVDHVILPAITLAFLSLAGIMRYMRNSAVEAMNMDYVKFARAKGLNESLVIRKYVRKNALIPVITVSGLLLAGLLGGTVVVEEIFNYPGIGWWTYQAIQVSDAGGIMGATLLFALTIIIANLVVDIIYAYLDPRIRLGD
ncbi:MAG: ABC transporter permease [Thermoplasmata archaeon]